MQTSIQKWGNSLGLRLPKLIAEELQIKTGARVTMKVSQGRLVITPQVRRRYSLDELLKGVNTENLHPETDTSAPQGREVW